MVPYEHQPEAQRLKFLVSESFDRVVCVQAKSHRVQQGFAAQEAKEAVQAFALRCDPPS